jgi:hypothetical protein
MVLFQALISLAQAITSLIELTMQISWSVTPQKPKIERLARSARNTLIHFAELSRAATTLTFLASSPSASAITAPYDFQRVFLAFATRKGPQWVGRPI